MAAQAEVIYQAAAHRQHDPDRSGKAPSLNYRVRTGLVYRMAQRLLGLRTDETILAELTQLTQEYFPTLFTGATYSQGAVEAVSAIQLATENLTRHGEKEPALYQAVQELFARYFTTRPYTTFVDYVCGSYNYCYVLSALPHICDEEILLQTLLKLTMFRQVQTAMHSIMVGRLALELLDRLIDRRPDLLSGQLGTTSPEEVVRRRKEFRRYLYSGALLHDIGKVLCSILSPEVKCCKICPVCRFSGISRWDTTKAMTVPGDIRRNLTIRLLPRRFLLILSLSVTAWMPLPITWDAITQLPSLLIRCWKS